MGLGMGSSSGRRDNMMQNMAMEVNAMEHERKRSQNEKPTKKQQTIGRIAFGVILLLVVIIIGAFVVCHL